MRYEKLDIPNEFHSIIQSDKLVIPAGDSEKR